MDHFQRDVTDFTLDLIVSNKDSIAELLDTIGRDSMGTRYITLLVKLFHVM